MLLGAAGALWAMLPTASSGPGNSQEREARRSHSRGQARGRDRSVPSTRREFPPPGAPEAAAPAPLTPLLPLAPLCTWTAPMSRLGAGPQRSQPKRRESEAGAAGGAGPKAKAGGGAGSESESGRRSGMMAAAPLLVRLSPEPAAGEKAILKLHAYFQSGKRSGGGECSVVAGHKPGTYWVNFSREQGTGGSEGSGHGRRAPRLRAGRLLVAITFPGNFISLTCLICPNLVGISLMIISISKVCQTFRW